MRKLLVIQWILCFGFHSISVDGLPTNVSGIPPPIEPNGDSAEVYIGFYIESLGNFKPTNMAFDVDLYLRMSWQDSRLRHGDETELALTNRQALDEIWLPDLYFANARSTHFHDVTVPNLGGVIFPDGTVALSRRVTMNVACNMNLKKYPMDEQTCCIRLASYANNISKVRVRWFTDNAISYNEDIDLPEMKLIEMKPRYCSSNTFAYPITERKTTLSEFSCLEGVVSLRRSVTYHLVQSYIPTGLIVVISWVSFWIDQAAIPARVSLSFTTLLTLSTMGAGLRYSLPPVSYAKAIDYWYGVCMLFVFAALIEFAVVNSLVRRANKCETVGINLMQSKFSTSDVAREAHDYGVTVSSSAAVDRGVAGIAQSFNGISVDVGPTNTKKMGSKFKVRSNSIAKQAVHVDQFCRFVFPLLFLIFNLFYWIIYAT